MTETQFAEVLAETAGDVIVSVVGDRATISTGSQSAVVTFHTRRSLTPSSALRLATGSDEPGLVVADLIDSAAAATLRQYGWSWWDRRGRLRLWLPQIGLRLDTPTRSYVTGGDGPNPRRPVAGAGGISLALALLIAPSKPPGIREIARAAAMAASTISRAHRHLTSASLIDTDGTPIIPELFWATSDAWAPTAYSVTSGPDGEHWALGGDAAAAHWGAPTLAQRRRFYCSDPATFDRHRFAHTDESGTSPIEIALAPSGLVVTTALAGMVHPVVAALDLSTSTRGREILADWTSIPGDNQTSQPVVWR